MFIVSLRVCFLHAPDTTLLVRSRIDTLWPDLHESSRERVCIQSALQIFGIGAQHWQALHAGGAVWDLLHSQFPHENILPQPYWVPLEKRPPQEIARALVTVYWWLLSLDGQRHPGLFATASPYSRLVYQLLGAEQWHETAELLSLSHTQRSALLSTADMRRVALEDRTLATLDAPFVEILTDLCSEESKAEVYAQL
jgi:hypothetical protein